MSIGRPSVMKLVVRINADLRQFTLCRLVDAFAPMKIVIHFSLVKVLFVIVSLSTNTTPDNK